MAAEKIENLGKPKPKFEVQTRDDNGELRFFNTLQEALDYASKNIAVWKISFALPTGESVRLTEDDGSWIYSPIKPPSDLEWSSNHGLD